MMDKQIMHLKGAMRISQEIFMYIILSIVAYHYDRVICFEQTSVSASSIGFLPLTSYISNTVEELVIPERFSYTLLHRCNRLFFEYLNYFYRPVL